MKTIFVEHQRKDKSFAVYVGGDDDNPGDYDRLYSYGRRYAGAPRPKLLALLEAYDYAYMLAKRIDARVESIDTRDRRRK
jgi:hypothetical protein